MGNRTAIEWADRTWNPVSGCTKVSTGCKHCYAETQAERFAGGVAFPNGFDITLRHHLVAKPLGYRKHARIFVNSMSDLFHKDIPEEFRSQIFGTMLACYAFNNRHDHDFLILTKRAKEMHEYFRRGEELIGDWADHAQVCCDNEDVCFNEYIGAFCPPWPLPNIWLGVSVELHKHTDRIKHLRRMPAKTRFVSLEPLLNGIDYGHLATCLEGIDWVIIGGESGAKARPCMPEWIRNCVRSARAAGCKVFVKQMGTWWANSNGSADYKGGLMDDWPEDLRVREFPGVQRG